jgi:23S rRNA (uridine2552-2'-O)-methyltransferase
MSRNKTSKAWLRRQQTDPFVRDARHDGYRSRAAYKLLEISKHDRLLRPGLTVVDLGAAPGSWSQVAASAVRPGGRVIALDIAEMSPVDDTHVIRGDFRDTAVLAQLVQALKENPVDLVLSDMAPNLSGVAATDQARCFELAERALEFALGWLKPGGVFLVKVFHGYGYEDFVAQLRRSFGSVQVRKPLASRDRSSEIYLLARRPVRREVLAREPLHAPSSRCDSHD